MGTAATATATCGACIGCWRCGRWACLRDIAALLTDTDPSPRATLEAHLKRVEAELAKHRALRDRLLEVLHGLDAAAAAHPDSVEPDIDAALLMKVIEKMTMFEQHLTPEQRTWFVRRREHVGEQAWQNAIEQWPELIDAVRAEMDAGTDPSDPRVQELMTRWDGLRQVFLDDDPEIRAAAGRAWRAMWKQHPEQLGSSPRVVPPEMWDYVQRARQSR